MGDAVPPSSAPDKIGNRYQVIEQLGRGGMAVVYRVVDTSRGATLALKQTFRQNDPSRDREIRALFESEFHTLAQLKHPSVIAVYDYGVDPAGPYYTMELLDGGDLTVGSPQPFRVACELIMQISSSLSLLHSRGLLHRDISPRNVRCTADGRGKLIDFGAMTPMGPCAQIVGTPAFMAPEVAHRGSLDARSDLFSLGATLYYALTGRLAFPARSMSELRDVWRQEPLPPSVMVRDIPPALDELVMSMLGIDPARRPRSAFEVMQRLAAIAGVKQIEASDASQAYLSTPTLVGRDLEQKRFREHMKRTLLGHGGGLLFESPAGFGRTRMLDACVLEAKTLGATVVRLRGGTADGVAFACAHELAAQLCENLPDVAWQCAREVNALPLLFSEPVEGGSAELRPLAEWRAERFALQSALTSFIHRVCRDYPMFIAIDDAELADEASLALIAALAHAAKGHALATAVAVASGDEASEPLSLRVLRGQCAAVRLAPLTAAETETLFASVFGNAPRVGLVADRIYRVAAGSLRESMALAQHLLDRKVVRYDDGNWILPPELTVHDLPASVEDAVQGQLARLTPLALLLVQTQAIALEGPWTRADYAEVAGAFVAAQVDDALNNLLRLGVLVGGGNVFTLKHHGIRRHLLAQLTEADRKAAHLRLADLCARSSRPVMLEVHHALSAGVPERAFERLAGLLGTLAEAGAIYESYPLDPRLIVTTLEAALEGAVTVGRRRWEVCEIRRHLVSMTIPLDTKLFYRHGPEWLSQLELDSGLRDYRATDAALPSGERLKAALEGTMRRWAATPEPERVYPLNLAIKHLAQYVTTAIVVGSRWCDTRLLESLPGELEPFAVLSPVLNALWQNVVAGGEMNYLAQPERARARVLEVYEKLTDVSVRDLPNVTAIRYAISYAVGVLEVSLGFATAEQWIEIMQSHPLQQVNAMYLRRIVHLYAGEFEAAERCRKQAEVLAVQASARQMFDVQYQLELLAQVTVGDLNGVKQVADRIEQMAAEVPSWRAQHQLAQGWYQRMRGDLPAAKIAFERAIGLANPDVRPPEPPPNLNVWINAAGGYTHVLLELGLVREAYDFALRSCAICEERAIGGWSSHLVRGLALAQAKLGDLAGARQRLDRLIEQRSGILPSRLLLDYEARARVAIQEKDTSAAVHFATLATPVGVDGGNTVFAKRARLLDEAKQAGLELDIPVTEFESSVLGSKRPRSAPLSLVRVTTELQLMDSQDGRVQRALELLCETTQSEAGHLFITRDGRIEPVASVGAPADPALIEHAAQYWEEQVAHLDITTLVTADGDDEALPEGAIWTSASGVRYRLAPLKAASGARIAHAGLVMLSIRDAGELVSEYWPMSAAIVTRLLAHGDVAPIFMD